jgi:glucose/arabinose dehydrogenase
VIRLRRALISLILVGGLLAVSPIPPAEAGGSQPTIAVDVVVDGLSIPWGLAFAPDGTMYFTERGGDWSSLAPPYTGTPTTIAHRDDDLYVNGETGLLDLELDPGFGTGSNRRAFTCQGHQQPGQAPRIQVISWRINVANDRARRVRDPLVDAATTWGQRGRHGGCRLEFDTEGNLFIGTGDGASSNNPQNLRTLGGKILRVDPDTGKGVPGNPWFDSPNPNRRRIWNYGHRNVQGLALRPGTTQLWSVEHGTNRDDEVNRVLRGRNFGWAPGPGYDESAPMTDRTRFPNAAVAKWSSGFPTIATSGATFLDGAWWEAWDGALAVACLAGEQLRIFTFTANGTLTGQVTPAALDNTYGRLRTPVQGPDGALYVTTANGSNDRILRVEVVN